MQISGRSLDTVTSVLFGTSPAAFQAISSEKLIALVPHRAVTSAITLVSALGRSTSALPFVVSNDPRVPEEVSFKAGYVNPVTPPPEFSSALLWGIAIADTRVPGYQSAEVKIARALLTCRVDAKDYVLNDDSGRIRGGLYRRNPWFGTDRHEPMPLATDPLNHAVVLHVGQVPSLVWHFWSASPRATLPPGHLQGCTVKVRAWISPGALLQVGMDYWRDPLVSYGAGGNNHEAGASNWYFPSPGWQEATFTDLGGVQF